MDLVFLKSLVVALLLVIVFLVALRFKDANKAMRENDRNQMALFDKSAKEARDESEDELNQLYKTYAKEYEKDQALKSEQSKLRENSLEDIIDMVRS